MKTLIALFFTSLFAISANADEGMWIPSLIHKYNITDMQQKGLRLSAEDLYSINHSSLKDAIVIFGRGCTADLVSDQGLLLTNHHCGFGRVQAHSTIEHDYLTDGFWAMSKEEELPNPGLTVTFLVYMEDVTDRIMGEINDQMTEKERTEKIKEISKTIIEEATEDNHYEAVVKPVFQGNQYFLYVQEIYKDIRLVGAPPSAIGKFGGDTDNWMWPRHTGDFSVFRIYANKDNEPAEYAEENVPYEPKKHFTVSLKGVAEGDFTMVYGYPYTTTEYLPSYAVELTTKVLYPERIKIRQKKLDIIGAAMNSDPEIRIQYASKQAGISNAWKKWIGVIKGLDRLQAVQKKQDLEADFQSWADHYEDGKYKNTLSEYKQLIENMQPLSYWTDYFFEAIWRMDITRFAARFRDLGDVDEDDLNEELEKLKKRTSGFFKDYNQPTDKKIFIAMMQMFYEGVEKDRLPDIFETIQKKFKNDFTAYGDWVYEKSFLVSEQQTMNFLDAYKPSKFKKLEKDPAYMVMNSFMKYYRANIAGLINELRDTRDSLNRIYMAGLMDFQPEKLFYPDANATLRVTYGLVKDYLPRDAVQYDYQTTLEGIMQKDDPDIYDYDVPDRLKELYQSKAYGRYGKDDRMNVCFIATNHTTGGNSGSPVLNADGHLIGLNFDRDWEGTMSDIMYDPEMCRNISLDIRYCLFIIDEFAGAGHLVDEMTIAE